MDLLYIENYFIFSVFIVLFLLEAGIALISLIDFEQYITKFKHYLLPIWEIDGTFAIFYVVNLEATYPTALNLIGSIYVAPVLFAGLFLLLRNAFLAYSELADKSMNEKIFVRIYALSTLTIALVLITVLSSTVSGIGINTLSSGINPYLLVFNGFNIVFVAAAILLALCVAIIFFNIKQFRLTAVTGMVLTITLAVLGLYLYAPLLAANILPNLYLIIIGILLIGLVAVMAVKESRYTKYALILVVIFLVNVFGQVQYPYLFGGTSSLQSYETSPAISGYVLLFSTAGGLLIALFLIFLVRLSITNGPKLKGIKRSSKRHIN